MATLTDLELTKLRIALSRALIELQGADDPSRKSLRRGAIISIGKALRIVDEKSDIQGGPYKLYRRPRRERNEDDV